MIRRKVLLSFVLGVFFSAFQLVPEISAASLYDPNDPLWELDSGNFERLVYGKNTAWIIEFYNSWCGHCIRFAPHWVEFARDIENWNRVLEIGVVNCNDAENVKLCRQYQVAAYPTIKLLPTNLNGSEQGHLFEGSRDLSRIRRITIDYLQSLNSTPSHWPSLDAVEANNFEEFWSSLPSDVNTAYVVLEPPESYVGREVILDLSGVRNVLVKRITSTSPLKDQLVEEFDNGTVVFLKLNRHDNKEVLNIFRTYGNETLIRDLIFETLTGKVRVKEGDNVVDPDKPDDKTIRKGVYMADLENALHYALRQEVGVHSDISGPALTALRDFVSVLRLYFPSSPPVESFLIKLSAWVKVRKGNMTGERFVKALDNLQTKTEYLPELRDYVGCKGSIPKYRGYPCSLWTLFHTLTLQAYDIYERINAADENGIRPQDVLFAIRGYVTHFFTCRECSLHFQGMAKDLENEIKQPKDGVMWLWQAHNKVNKRLSGDATEDPSHPKIQFPSRQDCEKCHIEEEGEEIIWDQNAVFRYLQYHYKKSNIKPVKEENSRRRNNSNDLDMHVTVVDDAGSTANGNKLSDYSFLLPILSLSRGFAVF